MNYSSQEERLLDQFLFCESEVEYLENQISALQVRKKRMESELAASREKIFNFIRETGVCELKHNNGATYALTIIKGKDIVDIEDEWLVPSEFCEIKKNPKKKEILEFINSGNKPNWATLKKSPSHLRISVKS